MHPLEQTILRELFARGEFAERVVPYLKEDYFYSNPPATIYKLYRKFFERFHVPPHFQAIRIGLDTVKGLNEQHAKDAQALLLELERTAPLDPSQHPWALEQAEHFCQDRALHCALQESIKIMDDPKESNHKIPEILKDALTISFDAHVGHNYFDDADARWDFYHAHEARIPFDLSCLNTATKGGVPNKSLNVVMAGTNVGKSLALVHIAASSLRFSKNVLYITMEMAEERIAERIDANMMNIPIDDLVVLSKADWRRKINFLQQSTTGRLVVKEYPTGQAHAGHFRALLQDLRLKQNFKPDMIAVDYITICGSSRLSMDKVNVNTSTLYRFVAEELRGLAVECGIPVWTAAQFNRKGYASTEPEITDIGESWGIPQTADFMFTLASSPELEQAGQLSLRIVKNRYGKKKAYSEELIGVDTDRMKLYDLSAAQLAASLPAAQPQPSNKPSINTFSNRRRQRPLTSLRKEAQGDD